MGRPIELKQGTSSNSGKCVEDPAFSVFDGQLGKRPFRQKLELGAPAECGAWSRGAELTGSVAVNQLCPLTVSGKPSLESTDGSFHACRPQFTRQDCHPEGAKEPGIEISDCKSVEPARKKGHWDEPGDREKEPAARE